MDQPSGSNREPIAITGCGWVTPVAAGSIAHVLAAAARFVPSPSGPGTACLQVGNELLGRLPDLPAEVKKDKGAWMTAVAIRVAFEHAFAGGQEGIAPADLIRRGGIRPERAGLVLGCALAGQLGMIRFASDVREQSARFVSPINFPQTVGNYVAGAMARAFNLRGPNVTLAGDTSGLDAIHEASTMLRDGLADVMLAGATEEVTDGFAEPLGRGGIVLSEAACWFVLERQSAADARSISPLASIRRLRRLDASQDRSEPDDQTTVSTFGASRPGAIFVESRLGHSLAASGPAALAAAIGAANGCPVPVADTGNSYVTHTTAASAARTATVVGTGEGGTYRLDVDGLAQADGTHHAE